MSTIAVGTVENAIAEFDEFVASFAQDPANNLYRTGYAVFLYTRGGKSYKEGRKSAAPILDECFLKRDSSYVSNQSSICSIYCILDSISKKLIHLKKKILVNWNNNSIKNFLLQPLKPPICRKKNPSPSTSSIDFEASGKNDECFDQQKAQVEGRQDCFPQVDGEVRQDCFPLVAGEQILVQASLKKLRTDCCQCNLVRNRFLARTRFLEDKVRKMRMKANALHRLAEKKVLNQTIKRKCLRIATLSREKSALKTRVSQLERQLGASVTKMEKNDHMRRRNRILEKKVVELKEEVLALKSTLKATAEERRVALVKTDELMGGIC